MRYTLGAYLLGAGTTHHQKERLPLQIFMALLKQKDLKGILLFFLMLIGASLNHLLIAVEDILLPEISSIGFEKVVFILGHPRSGTTYLHKALHGAPEVHTSSHYDLWFPSLILKVLGRPLLFLADWVTHHWSTKNHSIGIREELEEHHWLLMRFKSTDIPYVFPSLMNEFSLLKQCLRYTSDDFLFLKKCLQRVLYTKPSAQLYVGCPLGLAADYSLLRRHFPEAKILICARDSAEILPSSVDLAVSLMKRPFNDQKFQAFMRYGYETYSKKVFQNINAIFSKSRNSADGQIYIVLFERLKRDLRAEIALVLSFIELNTDLNDLIEKIEKFEFKEHQNRQESYEAVNLEEDEILEYQRNINRKIAEG